MRVRGTSGNGAIRRLLSPGGWHPVFQLMRSSSLAQSWLSCH